MAQEDGSLRDHDLLVRLDTKMDMVLANDADKERRLRAVEKKLWWLGGVSAAIGAAIQPILQLTGKA